MRCVDLIHELAAPTGDADPAALAGHLSECSRCAAWADRNALLGRLWDTTTPTEPSIPQWDAAWVQISKALDHAPSPEILRPASTWRRSAFVLVGLAQAAALLLALLYHFGSAPVPQKIENVQFSQPVETPSVSKVEKSEVEIDAGQLAVIDNQGVRIPDLALNENTSGVDFSFDGLNSLEAIATQ